MENVSSDWIEMITKTVIAELNKSYTMEIPVGVSARHVHLTQEHVEVLFGKGYQLKPFKPLMGGQYACEETVTLIGGKLSSMEKVRILGPVRKFSQVELAKTDALKLGVKAPVRESGDINGSAPIGIAGPKGVLYLTEGCIIAARHVHMSPADAAEFGVNNGGRVSVKFGGDRGGVFDNVVVRVDKSFTLEMHIDTDEGNCFGIKTGDVVQLIK